ncbi:MAG TPA: hypothetical protein P5514_02490 [Bacteroidales bacterium]|nr:hypothetical protein [Bacteroidales bacterium]HPE57461.1 hypothetical protein [Bacteroidales bacterium]HRX95789.1 hypothetical protein [Bacteroidales bacterium]
MKLYSISDKNHLIDVDPQLDNTRFYFLVNYLIYPKNMNYTVDVTGYTRGLENNILKGKQLMVYIPANDSEYDNVFVCTSENQNFKVDFGGKISPVNQNRIYTIPGLDFLPVPEIIGVDKKSSQTEEEEESETSRAKRFRIISTILLLLFAANLAIPKLTLNAEFFKITTSFLFIGTAMWFFAEEQMIRIKVYYFRFFLIAALVIIYRFALIEPLYPAIHDVINYTSLCPVSFLIVQWPLRKLFLYLFGREPIVDGNAKFADVVYRLILFCAVVILPIIIISFFSLPISSKILPDYFVN